MPCNGLDSYYAEMHGLIIGYGMGVASGKIKSQPSKKRLIGQNVWSTLGASAQVDALFSRLNSVPAFNRSDRMCVRLPIVPAGR